VRIIRTLFLALDLVTVAGALEGIAPGSARGLVLALVVIVSAVVLFMAAVFALAMLDQRRPPYPL
jgi:hypothetical protein